MILNNIKNNKDRGFTIVELLIVIVIIGILAAITIVSYTGITQRANGAKAISNAQSIQSALETYNADNSSTYPTTSILLTQATNAAKLPSGLTYLVAPTSGTGTTAFQIFSITAAPATGGKIVFWDYNKGAQCNHSALGVVATTAAGDTCLYYGAANVTANFGTTLVTAFAS